MIFKPSGSVIEISTGHVIIVVNPLKVEPPDKHEIRFCVSVLCVLNKLKYPFKISMDLCLQNYTDALNTKRCGVCHMCNRESLLHGVFCVCYLRYHEHIPLCINCSGKIERRKNRILEIAGTVEYYAIIRKIALINRHLPTDMLNIIMHNLGCLYGIFTLANNHFK